MATRADSQLIVIALGGNAITRADEEGTVDEQFENSRVAARHLADLIEQGHQLVITHGNGPQIGNFLLRNDAAAGKVCPLPMEVAVAHVEGGMGYMISRTLMNQLHMRGIERVVTTLINLVICDGDDPAFDEPTKPIGRVVTKHQAEELAKSGGWSVKEITPGQWRRVVPSPKPLHINEIEVIRAAVEAGQLMVVCGGGGIPVVRDETGRLVGAKAVIDKDLASALLARELNADAMMILTDVDNVCINFGKSDEQAIARMTLAEAKRWFEEGQFPPGSMGPKMAGAIDFLENCDNNSASVIIGPLHRAADAFAGRTGTRIVKS